MSSPDVSVILTVRNAEKYLREAIESVLAQSKSPAEIILIDGQSEDRTPLIARSYKQVRYQLQPDRGLANARNLGLQLARADLIAFLDGDDLWLPQKLERQATVLLSQAGALFCVGWMRLFMEGGVAPPRRFDPAAFDQGQIGYTPGALLSYRSLFQKVGLVDPAFSVACDSDWFARVLDAGLPSAVLPEVVLLKRIHGENASRDMLQYRKEMTQVVRLSIMRKRARSSHRS
jgi:glycosyltransferase involved in cell wall biosynthesis